MRTEAYVDNRERLNLKSRKSKYKKLLAVISRQKELKDSRVLDIGTSSGYIQSLLAKHTKEFISVDVIDERKEKRGYKYVQIKGAELPFNSNSFDVVISSHVIEHIPEQQKHIDEIHRVLKKGGIAYLSTPSKYSVIEPHYKLPFLSWVPRSIGRIYLKVLKSKDWNVYPLSRIKLKSLNRNRFSIEDQVPVILNKPKQFSLDQGKRAQIITKKLPLKILKILSPFTPAIIVVLKKS